MADGPIQWQAPQPITIGPTGVQNLSGAANATLFLGAGLVAVSLWQDVITPVWDSAWSGEPLKITLPAGLALGEVLFVGALVALTSFEPEWASVTVWFVIALWVVWIINNGPTVVKALTYLTAPSGPGGNLRDPPAPGGNLKDTGVAPVSGAAPSGGGGQMWPALPRYNV
jgi:hypothetical protein